MSFPKVVFHCQWLTTVVFIHIRFMVLARKLLLCWKSLMQNVSSWERNTSLFFGGHSSVFLLTSFVKPSWRHYFLKFHFLLTLSVLLAERTCPMNMKYNECGSPCADTCSNSERTLVCEDHCIDGCFCPPGKIILFFYSKHSLCVFGDYSELGYFYRYITY